MTPRFAPGPIDAEARAAAVASLRTVGGIYDHVAAYVEGDTTSPISETGDDRG